MNIIEGLPPRAEDGELVAIDTEVFGIPPRKLHRPVGTFACLSVCYERDLDTVYQTYDSGQIPAILERINPGKWVFQNAMFDLRQMRRFATIPPRPIWDTKIVDQGLWGGYYSRFDLNSLAVRYLGQVLDKSTRESFVSAEVMSPEMIAYAALDPVVTLKVALKQIEYIDDHEISMDHYWEADHGAIWAILDMPMVRMDTSGWSQLSDIFLAKRTEIQNKYPDINLASPAQVNARLCAMLGRHSKLKSTDEESLLLLIDEVSAHGKSGIVEFIQDVLAFRQSAKAASTYGRNWLDNYIEDGEFVASDWKPVQATTGRMASGDPNLQNIPSRDHPIFRTLFIARPNHKLIVVDVSQQEPRITAKLSGDKYLTDALRAGISSHVITGKRLFHDENFSKADPRYPVAKQVNLGLAYGLTPAGLASRTGISPEEAEELYKTYFEAFPGVKAYIDKYRKKALAQGYVSTLLGRRSWINPYVHRAENNAINAPVQGTGGDQMKIAMSYLHRESARLGLPFCLVLVVHDEMVCDVPEDLVPEYSKLITEAWNHAGKLTLGDTIPMVVEIAVGNNWGCKH